MQLNNYFTSEEILWMKNTNDLIEKCVFLVQRLFANKTDKAGEAYIYHLYRVAQKGLNNNLKAAALLHDVFEDTKITAEDLRYINIPEDIITIVSLLTVDKSLPYSTNINLLIKSANMDAIRIKYDDMTDNYNVQRLAKLDEQTAQRLQNKYSNELIKLERILKIR